MASPEDYIDFVAVGNNGADFSSHIDKRYLGSVASGVLRQANLNVLFVAWIKFSLDFWFIYSQFNLIF